jgi:AcrR family transcriptional regulator
LSGDILSSQVRAGSSAPSDGYGKQAAIIQAATRIFLAEGYSDASMDAIARQAGVSKQTIYNHFGSKENLFSDVVSRRCLDMLSALLETEHARHNVEDTLREFARTLLRVLLEPSALALHRLILSESARFPEVGDIYYRAGPERGNRLLAEYLEAQCRLGHLCVEAPRLAAEHFTGSLIGPLRTRALVLNRRSSPQKIRQVVDHAVACFMALHGAKTGRPDAE